MYTSGIGQTVTGFWTELLEIEIVGPNDRILELGGNSLVITMLANRIEMEFGIRPSMEDLFTMTLSELVELCDQLLHEPLVGDESL